ncbi:kinase-like protein [Ceratobasidium sp. AG-I]|nr:kinase-like protein [Ceratobasidium sp. AG-I]
MSRSNADSIPRSPELDASDVDRSNRFPDWMLKLEGTNVANRLKLGPILGNGAFGVVYVGNGLLYAYNRPVAVKVLSTKGLDKNRRRLIEQEIVCHRRVSSHPGVVTVHDVLEDSLALYAIMDLYLEGDLFKCITEDELYVGNDSMIKGVFSQLLDAVEFCHGKGVYHRDLKPENVLCRNRGNTVVLTDFGLATRHSISRDFRCGSEFYMSPECVGYSSIDAYSTQQNDIWALGVILVNMVTCRNPWKRADMYDRGFAAFHDNPVGYIKSTLPVSVDTLVLLSRIFKISARSRMSISSIRKAIARIDRLLLTPAEAARAPEAAYDAATGLFEVMATRRPHVLMEHYEDMCVHFPALVVGLCDNLRESMAKDGLIEHPEDIFSDNHRPLHHSPQELPEWAKPIQIEVHSERDISDYPQSPDMSRDSSAETAVSGGPITPATYPTQVADDVPEAALDGVEQVGSKLGELKVSGNEEQVTEQTSSGFSSRFGPRIARVFGSPGGVFFR